MDKSSTKNSSPSLRKDLADKKFLIIQQKMIGDVLTSTILCEAIKKEFPTAEVHYLVNQHTLPVLENNPYIDKKVVITAQIEKSVKRFYKFLLGIKNENYDVVIDVYGKIGSALVTAFSGAEIKLGYQKKKFARFLYTHKILAQTKRRKPIALAYENRLNLLKPILGARGIDYNIQPKIYITNTEREEILAMTANKNIDLLNKSYIMVNVLGSSSIKTYPLKYMATLLDEVAEKFPDLYFLFNYIPSQKIQVEKILTYCKPETKRQISPFYAPSLRQFIVLTSFCKMVIGNEGGAINMGKALKLPTFAIFSPWIRKEAWGAPENDSINKTVHLKDYKPDLFKNYNQKAFKENSLELYQIFKPELIKLNLLSFLKKNKNN